MRTPAKAALGMLALGAAGLVYSAWEAQNYTLRRATVPALSEGQPELRILHLSDLHLVPGQKKKKEWVRSLSELRPDAVIATGDFLSHPDAVPEALDALDAVLDIPGAFVLGSNDYFAPRPLNPAQYLRGPSQLEPSRPMLPWPDLVAGLTDAGWLDLSNARAVLEIDGRTIDLRGVDDPHIARDRYDDVAGAFLRRMPISRSVWCTLRICACSTAWPPTALTSSSPGTPMVVSSHCPDSARWSPTAISTASGPRAFHLTRAPICTSLQASAPLLTHPFGLPARLRPPCSP
jgi:predicted MPP superfamily phosphohydrolase